MGSDVFEGLSMWPLSSVFFCQVAVLWISVQAQPDCTGITGGVAHNTYCYVFSDIKANWTAAEGVCVTRGGHLASIPNLATQNFLNTELKNRTWNASWVGGVEEHGPWRWVADEEVVSAQGCYTDKSFDRDLPTEIIPAIPDLIPAKCIEACKNMSMPYAGVQNQLSCFCGNSFGKYGATEGCTVKCEITKTEYCGGFGRNFIYQIGASYANWATGQPNDKGGYQTCAAIDFYVADGDFSDEVCSNAYRYICSVGDTVCNGSNQVKRKDVCYYISTNTRTWYDARAQCASMSGNLLKVSNASIHTDIKNILRNQNVFDKFYIGLVSGIWKWASDGKTSTLVYSNWQSSAPSQRSATCLKLTDAGSNDYKWTDATCEEKHNYVCEIERSSTTTAVPPTSATATQSTTAIPSTTATPSVTAIPSTSATPSVTAIPSTTATQSTVSNLATSATNTSTSTPAISNTGSGSLISNALSTTDSVNTNSTSSSNTTSSPFFSLAVTTNVTSQSSASSSGAVTSNGTPPTPSSVTPNSYSSSSGRSNQTGTNIFSTTPVSSSTRSEVMNVTVEGPNTGGSTQNGGELSVVHIVLIVCFVILAVAITVGVILFVYYKKKHDKSSVSPYNVADERAMTNGHVAVSVEDDGNADGLAVTSPGYFNRDRTSEPANGNVANLRTDIGNGRAGSLRSGRGTWRGERIVIEE